MTNEKWFDSLTVQDKAKWLANTCRSVANEYYHENQKGTWSANYWENWLQEEHAEKKGVKEE